MRPAAAVDLVEDRPAPRVETAAARVAYLTNAYPKISHSFIRAEILALERRGFDVERVSVRASPEALLDPLDQRERGLTTVLLGGRSWTLARAVARRAVRHPGRFAKALWLAAAAGRRAAPGPVRALAYFVEACRLAELCEARGVPHVHVHFGTNPAAVARLASRLGALTYSLTIHGPDEFDAPVALGLRDKIADARFVAAVSHYGRGQLLRWSDPVHWKKIVVIRCGADASFFAGAPNPHAGLASSTLLCVARLSTQKGLPLLIDAAAILAREGRPFGLRIIGDGELRPELEARIAAAGLGGQVTLLGWRGAQDVRRELGEARALVMSSLAEGLPVVLMEAMAMGRPVIATAIAGIPELVDTRTGWLVPSGSAPALADAMDAALAAGIGTLKTMARLGQARVGQAHDVDANAALLAERLRPFAAVRR